MTARRFKSMTELVAWTATQPPEARHVLVLHDDGCTPSLCRCSPEYVLEELTTETLVAGQRAQAKWVKETVS